MPDEPEEMHWVLCETATGKVLDRWTESPDGRLLEGGDDEAAVDAVVRARSAEYPLPAHLREDGSDDCA